MKAAIYARVSTSEQSPNMQLNDLHSMAEARGFEVTEEYIDKAVSGGSDRRPALDRLMADAKKGKFKVILVWKLDRFARSLRHLVNSLDELEGYGVDFVSYSDPIDTSTPSGRLLFQIIGAMAEFERALIKERVTAGIRAAKKRGVKVGRPKASFDLEKALELRRQGLSLRAVANDLGGISKDTLRMALRGM